MSEHAVNLSAIIPSQEDFADMARRRYQRPNVLRTDAKRPQWYFRARVDVLVAPGQTERREQTYYLGFTDEKGKRQAEKERDAILDEAINRPQVLIQSQVKFADVIAAYKRDHVPTLRAQTQGTYLSRVQHWIEPHLGQYRLCDITPQIVQRWINDYLPKATSTRKAIVGHFRLIWTRARAWGYTQTSDPSEFVSCGPERGENQTRIPTLEQVRRIRMILAAEDSTLADMLDVAIGGGLRISEIRGLSVGQLDFSADAILITRRLDRLHLIDAPKSRKSRRAVPMGALRPMLLNRAMGKQPEDLVFATGSYECCQRHLVAAAEAAGFSSPRFGWHSLRRCHNTWFRKSGARPEDARDQLGHATVKQNDVYLIAEDEDFQRRAEIVKALHERVIGPVQ